MYSDIDFQSAISVSSTGNSQTFTELTNRLAFVNFSSPGAEIIQKSCEAGAVAVQSQHIQLGNRMVLVQAPNSQRQRGDGKVTVRGSYDHHTIVWPK